MDDHSAISRILGGCGGITNQKPKTQCDPSCHVLTGKSLFSGGVLVTKNKESGNAVCMILIRESVLNDEHLEKYCSYYKILWMSVFQIFVIFTVFYMFD